MKFAHPIQARIHPNLSPLATSCHLMPPQAQQMERLWAQSRLVAQDCREADGLCQVAGRDQGRWGMVVPDGSGVAASVILCVSECLN